MDGTFEARVIRAELVESNAKKTPGCELEFAFLDANGEEHTISTQLWLSGGAVAISLKSMRTCGFVGYDVTNLDSMLNQPCQIVIESEQYKDKWYPKVKWINASGSTGGGSGQPRMEDAAKKTFGAQMRGLLMAAEKANGAPPPARAAGGAPRAPAPRPSGPPSPPPGFVPEGPGPGGDVDDEIGF